MFWGCALKQDKPYKTQQALEENDYPVLHLSNVALPKNASGGKVSLLASMGKDLKDLTIATLQKDKVDQVALDLYINISQNVTLSVSGGELHLSGFFEPQRDEMDENMFLDEDDEEEEEEVQGKNGNLNASLKQAKVNAMKNAKGGASDEDEDDDEDEEYDDEDDEDEEDSEEEVVAKKPQ